MAELICLALDLRQTRQDDEKFWGNFNVIPPEEKLNDAISKISSKIEETEE